MLVGFNWSMLFISCPTEFV